MNDILHPDHNTVLYDPGCALRIKCFHFLSHCVIINRHIFHSVKNKIIVHLWLFLITHGNKSAGLPIAARDVKGHKKDNW